MKKQLSVASLSIFLAWTVVDLLLHRLLLAPYYAANKSLWRPMGDLNIPLLYGVIFTLIAVFVVTYKLLVKPKTFAAGLLLGALLGLALGVSSGLGTYIHMPIPLALALGWLLGGWVKGLVAGAIIGAVIKDAGQWVVT